jgi:S-adenosylmethionine:tRNA ribosyltransferase-isomerase
MRTQSKRVATGTTSLRTLESLFWLAAHHRLHGEWLDKVPQRAPYGELDTACQAWGWTDQNALDHLLSHGSWNEAQLSFETQLMIVPGYRVRMVHGLITNFHQPGSTLLCLVAAFVGGNDWKEMYAAALTKGYRFLSYGDGSLLLRS